MKKVFCATAALCLLFLSQQVFCQGFSSSAANWTLPSGGKTDGFIYSFHEPAYTTSTSENAGSQSWGLAEIDGDGKPDLVVYAENQNGAVTALSPTNNPYWKVYLNTGNGFSSVTNWTLPAGGKTDGFVY